MQPKSSRNFCVAYGCSNTPAKNAELSFHHFPKEKQSENRAIWIAAVKRKDWQPSPSSTLCSEHFTRESYRTPPGSSRRALLKPNAKPTIFNAFPAYLQPPAKKRRRSPTKRVVEEEADELPPPMSPLPDCPITPKQSERQIGRPRQPPELYIGKLQRKVRTLQQRVRRLDKKARVQRNLLQLLQKESKIQHAQLESIDGCLSELVLNEATNKGRKTKKTFSQKIKEFSITMFYYSPKAYAYLRSNFNLPSSRTIRSWLETVECEPGFLTDVLKNIAAKDDGKNVYSLVIDSMAIRKRLILNKATNQVLGHVTIGDTTKMASEALVLLLVPVLGGIRHPVGYFFVDKVDSDVQTKLVQQCLQLTAEHKIRIVNVTCDGCNSNLATLKKLGADVPNQPYFKHPYMDHQVFTLLDPVHMLKLARNAIGSLRQLKSEDGVIDYKYIEDLHKLQENIGLRLANKLTKRHMNWKNMKMKVKLAAQMLSSSVADALEYLQQTDEKFKEAMPTVKFIRQVCLIICKKNI